MRSAVALPARRVAALILLMGGAACALSGRPAPAVRAAVVHRHVGTTVELRQSCFYGELYDDNEKWLLTPYPPAETSHINDLSGHPLHPGNVRGIVPAGRAFVVERVEFPDTWTMARRLLTTPRENPWVYLRPQGEAASGRPFVVVLPLDLGDEAAVEAAWGQALAPEGEASGWLAARPAPVRLAIANKQASVGMAADELRAACGAPPHWFVDRLEGADAQVAWYPTQEAWLVGDRVVALRPGRRLPQALPAPPRPADTGR